MVSRQSQKNAGGVIGDAEVGQQGGQLWRAIAGNRHAPGQLREAELDAEARCPLRASQQAREERVVVGNERALAECQRVEQLFRPIEREDTDVVADEHDVGTGTDGQADGPPDEVVPVHDLSIRRTDHHGSGPVVVWPYEVDLLIPLNSVAHGGDDEIDIQAGNERDAGLRIGWHGHQTDTEKFGDASGNVDFEPGKPAAWVANREAGIVGAQSDAEFPPAQNAHKNVGRLQAITRCFRNTGKTPGSSRYQAGCPRHRTSSASGGTTVCPGTLSRLPR